MLSEVQVWALRLFYRDLYSMHESDSLGKLIISLKVRSYNPIPYELSIILSVLIGAFVVEK